MENGDHLERGPLHKKYYAIYNPPYFCDEHLFISKFNKFDIFNWNNSLILNLILFKKGEV